MSNGLEELKKTHPDIYDWLQGQEISKCHYFLDTSKNGMATCYYLNNNSKKYLYSTYDPKNIKICASEKVILLVGLGLGYEMEKVYDVNKIIYVYEPDPEVWNVFLQVEDNIKYLYYDNIYFFVSSSFELKSNDISGLQMIESSNAKINKDIYAGIYQKTIKKQRNCILIYEYHVFARNLYEAFGDLGYNCHFRPWIGESFTREDIKEIQPDVIITININQYIRDIANLMGVFYVSWTIDSPSFTLYDYDNTKALSFHFCYDKRLVEDLKAEGFLNIGYLPPATKIQAVTDVTNKDLDISFVGCVSYDAKLWSVYDKYLSNDLAKFMWEVIESQSDLGSGSVWWMLCKILNSMVCPFGRLFGSRLVDGLLNYLL